MKILGKRLFLDTFLAKYLVYINFKTSIYCMNSLVHCRDVMNADSLKLKTSLTLTLHGLRLTLTLPTFYSDQTSSTLALPKL
jgi:hypothetical protein